MEGEKEGKGSYSNGDKNKENLYTKHENIILRGGGEVHRINAFEYKNKFFWKKIHKLRL